MNGTKCHNLSLSLDLSICNSLKQLKTMSAAFEVSRGSSQPFSKLEEGDEHEEDEPQNEEVDDNRDKRFDLEKVIRNLLTDSETTVPLKKLLITIATFVGLLFLTAFIGILIALNPAAAPRHTPRTTPKPRVNNNLRLIGGSLPNEGNLIITRSRDGFTGPICDDTFNDMQNGMNQANVACRQLGYSGAERFTRESFFGRVNERFALDEVKCRGNEDNLEHCNYVLTDNCGPSEGAGVVCTV